MKFTDVEKNFLTYSGPFSMRIISGIGKFLMDNLEAPEIVKIRAYKVFIELTQNVALYSSKRLKHANNTSIGEGFLSITEDDGNIKLVTKNNILPEHKSILINNCNSINQSTENQLKEKKHLLRREASFSESGAHIGLITISLISHNPIHFEFEINNKTESFIISSLINKE